ncbi:MAG: hypothetical protein AAFQ44_10000, partial [Pseudomonadota bacterium]
LCAAISAAPAQVGSDSVHVSLQPPAGTRLTATQIDTLQVRQNDGELLASERRSTFQVDISKSSAEGGIATLELTTVNWDPAGPNFLTTLAMEAALGEAEIGKVREVRFAPSGKTTGFPAAADFDRNVFDGFTAYLQKYFDLPSIVKSYGRRHRVSVAQLAAARYKRARAIAAPKVPDFAGNWLLHTLVFPYSQSVRLGSEIERAKPLKTVRVIAPTPSKTTLTVTRDSADPKRLIASFETVYDAAELAKRVARQQAVAVQALFLQRMRQDSSKRAEHEAWANETMRKMKAAARQTRVDRTRVVIDADSGWPVTFETTNVETTQGIRYDLMTPVVTVFTQGVVIRFSKR